MVSGHNRLKYQESLVNQGSTEPHCRFCGDEFLEISWHLMGECSALWRDSFEALYLASQHELWVEAAGTSQWFK